MFTAYGIKHIASVAINVRQQRTTLIERLTGHINVQEGDKYMRLSAEVFSNNLVYVFKQEHILTRVGYESFKLDPCDQQELVHVIQELDFAIQYPELWSQYQMVLNNEH